MKSRFTWIFDLDNTLHDASPHIMPHINRSMTAYVQRHLRLSEEDAAGLRVRYWRAYGATLLGLMHHHGVDPDHFLWHTHQFPDLARMVVAESNLRHTLRRLRGRRIIFSNAPHHYVRAVLEVLGVEDLFDAVYCIEHSGYQPKPSIAGLRGLLHAERLRPARAVLVEDTLANLRPARRLGLKTVWVTRETRFPGWIDAKVSSVIDLPKAAASKGFAR